MAVNRERRGRRSRLSHVDTSGRVRMVDVGGKAVTEREAVAQGRITVGAAALRAIRAGKVKKGGHISAWVYGAENNEWKPSM